MFKKSKNNKLLPPPAAPTYEEILKDIETFQVKCEPLPARQKAPDGSQNSLDVWWNLFERFVEDCKDLSALNGEIHSYKLKLESRKIELETETQLIKGEIKGQQELLKTILE